MIFLLFRKANR